MEPVKPVFGAQHPPWGENKPVSIPNTPKKKGNKKRNDSRHSSDDSFENYELKTNDAWDMNEDDFMFNLNMNDVKQTADQVIYNHSKESKSQALSNKTGPGVGRRLETPNVQQVTRTTPRNDERQLQRLDKFERLICAAKVDLEVLRKESWQGVPPEYRSIVWKILCGYLPPALDRRQSTLEEKRKSYNTTIKDYYKKRLEPEHQDAFRQIHIDIPRMSPLIPIFQQKDVQEVFERILFIWAIRNPGSGYVQGINDLLIPYFIVFASDYINKSVDISTCTISEHLSPKELNEVEADSYWCFKTLLDGIQDNYTFAQPGIQAKVNCLKQLISRVDDKLHQHLESENVEFLQFSFRWMNNLLIREVPISCCLRIWDTYLSERNGFASFHVYVCAALLLRFSPDLRREKDFQGILLFLQNLPTRHWTNEEIKELLARAYEMQYKFDGAPNHLTASTKNY